jgi:hypothetical protein
MLTAQAVLITAGGKITCRRCNAMSKRTRVQCGAPAVHGKAKCKVHGGFSTGPRTQEGLERCAQVKTVHGKDTRQDRKRERDTAAYIRYLAGLLGLSVYSARLP